MKQKIRLWQLMGFALASLFGTILHFLYDWTGKAKWIAPFSGINESTWEHMKLIFWPMLIYAALQSLFFREKKDFWCIKAQGTVLALALIPMIFYTYNGVIGRSPDWINIAIFFVTAAIAYIYEARLLNEDGFCCRSQKAAITALIAIAALFVIFTFKTPRLEIFRDPISGAYGI